MYTPDGGHYSVTVTGGHVASTVMEDPRHARYFKAGLVAPSEQTLIDFGVPAAVIAEHGFASLATAEAMASVVRSRLGASLGLGLTGVLTAGTGGDVPPGTIHVALNDGETRSASMVFPTIPAEIKRWGMLNALNLIRLRLLGEV